LIHINVPTGGGRHEVHWVYVMWGKSDDFDVIVLGAGAGGMTAAAVAAAEGLRVLLLEKAPVVGGTTAISGGMVWIPNNPKMTAAGRSDSRAAAEAYLAATVPGPADDPLRTAFLDHANAAIAYLETNTSVRLRSVVTYPDYYPDLPGATLGGRVLEPEPFDGRRLGADFALLRKPLPEFMLFGGMMLERADVPHFRRAFRSPRSALRVARLLLRHAKERCFLERGATLCLGNALVARLLHSLRQRRVEIRLGAGVSGLMVEDGTAVGVTVNGQTLPARRGIVLATGGFSHDPALRARLLPAKAGMVSAASPDNTGDGIRIGLGAGGVLGEGAAGNAFWTPVSCFRRPDGAEAVFPHILTDRGKPGMIAVNQAGERFTNEAVSYHAFVQAMFRVDNESPAIPAWLICDRKALWTYGLGRVKPFALSLREPIDSGYLARAESIAGLAARIGVDGARLVRTVAGFNEDAAAGRDRAFGRGGDAYQRHVGDPDHAPNACVAPIVTPPFYAVMLRPGDLGTAAGLVTDASARVLGADGVAIRDLYACGNDMNSLMRGAYPGPGITLGPALTFGYLAAKAIAGGGVGGHPGWDVFKGGNGDIR
jgi:succinate dehydrogenase/fumarate reductase flavoprotein subunit